MRWMICALLMMSTIGAWAQLQPEVNWERYNKIRRQQQQKKEAPSKGLPWLRLVRPGAPPDTSDASTATQKLQWLGSNAYGELYVLPQDNMPMLKPVITRQMPTMAVPPADSNAAGKMPNGMRVQQYSFRK